MEQIYIIGDMHTVSAFRLSGVIGVISGGRDAAAKLEDIIRKGDAAIVAVTNDLADDLSERINEITSVGRILWSSQSPVLTIYMDSEGRS